MSGEYGAVRLGRASMTDDERNAIRASIRQLLADMASAEKRGDDIAMVACAIEIEDKAHELRKHAEDNGL
jgi:hypothetical protein